MIGETQFIVFMADDHVKSIPIKHHGNDLFHWDMNDIIFIFFRYFGTFHIPIRQAFITKILGNN